MASDLLTTSGINNLVNNFKIAESNKKINPLTTRKTYYQNLDTAYSTLSSKLDLLKSLLSELKTTGASSIFSSKKASSSNTNFVNVTTTNSAVNGASSLRVNQLAKNDIVMSQDLTSTANSSVITSAGTHNFVITAGDGSGGTFTSTVSAVFDASDFTAGVISNQKVMEKLSNAINSDKATVLSNSVTGSTLSSGSFTLNLNGTSTQINYTAGTYSAVMDSIVTQINSLSGITAEKIINGSNYQLKITVTDSSKYLTISGDTGTLVSELNIAATKEKGASGIVSASVFSPAASYSQLSITAKETGYDYRILSLSDSVGGQALSSVGLNLGGTRQTFVQNAGTDTPGYVYSTAVLNSKIEFNGINIERNSNVISDLLTGATITLKSLMQSTDSTVNLSISNDESKVKEKIQDFVTKFNDVYNFIKEKSTSNKNGRGIFVGDSSASSLLSILGTTAYSTVTGIPQNEINTLSKLGITFNSSSGLSISNSSQLDTALADKINQVEALFNSTSGIANYLYDRVNPYLGVDGYITKTKTSFGSSITALSDSITSAQSRIDKNAESLRNRYIKLQTQLAQLLSNQSYFSFNSGFFS